MKFEIEFGRSLTAFFRGKKYNNIYRIFFGQVS